MSRPSFQFYPDTWKTNIKLRRCSPAARGAWIDILCALHDSDDYGMVRWPLAELAQVAGVDLKLAKELVAKDVLKGADRGPVTYAHTPRHAGKDGEPVTLVDVQDGPCWYSSRLVRDEWLRSVRGKSSRFTSSHAEVEGTAENGSTPSPSRSPTHGMGDGPSTSSSSPSPEVSSLRSDSAVAAPNFPPSASKPEKTRKSLKSLAEIQYPSWWPHEKWAAYLEMRRRKRATATDEAILLMIRKVTAWRDEGQDILAIFDQSIMNSYTGLFPVKQNGGRNGNHSDDQQRPASFGASVARAVDRRAGGGGSLFGDGGASAGEASGEPDTGRVVIEGSFARAASDAA